MKSSMELTLRRLLPLTIIGAYVLLQPLWIKAQASSDSDWRVLSKAIYKCGQITADKQWIQAIDASRSRVTFPIDRTKSDRDWQADHCDEVLHITGISQ